MRVLARGHGHIRHHARFYASALTGFLLWLAMGKWAPPFRLVAAGDAFFAVYLVLTIPFFFRATPEHMRRRASFEDEGIVVIVLITVIAVVLSFYSIFAILNRPGTSDALHFALSIAGVPLGWLSFHTVAASHYSHLYYAPVKSREAKPKDASGLQFPKTDQPSAVDFLYYSFVVGMTAQVSDVQVLTARMRRVTLIHGVASFFFNTVILALAVNVAAGAAH
jgi:uncharacterized membrane protein